jgi:CheY-like chemotaxis protein
VDVISHIFESYGASLEWAKTPNDIFKCLAQSKDLDAVFLTETLPGIRLNSFCKTLKSRLSKLESKPQLFLSVSNPEIAESVFEYVDHIFYRPADNQTFLNKLIQQLDKVSHDKTVDEQRVLIVEDDEIQQLILGQLLSDFNINSDTADNGESAIDFLVDNNPSIIFMDCIMPGMGGIEATKKIRANETENDLKQTTIIGATALTGHKEKQECIEAGMDYVISKPYKEEEILRLLKNYLAIQRIS